MLKDFLYKSRYYLIALLLFIILCVIVSSTLMDKVLYIDLKVMDYIRDNLVNDKLTVFFKIVTNLGSVWFFVGALILMLVVIKDKRYFSWSSRCLITTYLCSVALKNIFRRERPLSNLIEKPFDFAFPSGHTMCSVAFFGILMFIVLRRVKNKPLKIFLVTLLSLIILIVPFSRLYLGVHYLSDVVCGFICGLLCLLMFVNYVKIKKEF